MEYEDTVRIATPEGVELELELAGIGSRLTARVIDVAIETAVIVAALLVFFDATSDSSISDALTTALAILIGFLGFWAYDILFESFNSGQTPGKRWNRLRVIGERGEPESFSMAAVRNIMRLVDEVLTLFLGALISIVRSSRNQRLGDIAAGTLVIRERPPAERAPEGSAAAIALDRAFAWDTTAITDRDLIAVRQFLDRRGQIMPHARAHVADELAAKLRPRVAGADDVAGSEEFLELLAAVKARRP
jgi:uncharacterized RDD family membrane protein YckC